jgi:2-amino-4-hydroxy-6-hydroxymethyldihydropteridine diphosphokinase
MKKTYLSIGGNLGDTVSILIEAFKLIKSHQAIHNVKCSHLYKTTPVGFLHQPDFINAAIGFETTITQDELLNFLQHIERLFKKDKKQKNGPRTLDIDILFMGKESCNSAHLILPHPRWNERLFVLVPLLDLTKTIELPDDTVMDLEEILKNFNNIHNEIITKIDFYQNFI